MAVREISQINIIFLILVRHRNYVRLPAMSTNWKLYAKWHWIDNSVIAIVRQEVDEPLDYQQPSRVYRNLLPNKTRGKFYDLYPASVAPGRILGGQFCIRSMLMKDSAEQ